MKTQQDLVLKPQETLTIENPVGSIIQGKSPTLVRINGVTYDNNPVFIELEVESNEISNLSYRHSAFTLSNPDDTVVTQTSDKLLNDGTFVINAYNATKGVISDLTESTATFSTGSGSWHEFKFPILPLNTHIKFTMEVVKGRFWALRAGNNPMHNMFRSIYPRDTNWPDLDPGIYEVDVILDSELRQNYSFIGWYYADNNNANDGILKISNFIAIFQTL